MGDKPSSQAIKDFLGEAEEIIENLNLDLMSLGDSAESGDGDPDLVNGIFRGAHSIKGLAGMFGFDDVSALAHQMENLLDCLRLGKVSLNPVLVETLFDGLESLTRLVHGKSENDDFTLDLSPVLARIQSVANGGGCGDDGGLGGLGIAPEILAVLTEYEEHRLLDNVQKGRNLLRVQATFELTTFDQELAEISEILKKHGEVISTLPCAGDSPDKIAFQIICGSALGADQVRKKLDREDAVVESLCTKGKAPNAAAQTRPTAAGASTDGADSAPPALNEAGSSEAAEAVGASLRSISRTVRVDIDKLDNLMNIVGELVLAKGAINTICQNIKSEGNGGLASDLGKATRTLERRLHELQQGVMDVRMVPVGQLFEKMNRIVRRVSTELKKKITLDVRGSDTELDKLIIEDLSDPLMHIIRNSLDHGIEPAAERRAAGKPEVGTICLWAAQKGNHVVIEVRDDGRGIDPERVRRKAVEKGLISEHAELSRDQIFDLIFSAGFSTKDQVSDLSGRGVGMDVVKNNIAMLSGMIEMDSTVGQGTSLSITLPITLAIIKALIVKVRGKTYAIPITSVLETLMVERSAIKTIERREVIELRNSTLPLLWLDRVFDLPGQATDAKKHFIAVVGLAEKKIGIVVDELLGQQDVVIKSLGEALSFVRGIAGAADLGNQKTILVLDVGGLMSEALRGEATFYV